MKKLIVDKTVVAEYASAISYAMVAAAMVVDKFKDEQINSYAFMIVFIMFGFLQGVAVIFKHDMILLRVCMSWISASVWSWLAATQYRYPLSMVVLTIGIINMYSFIYLVNRVSIDWNMYFKEE